MVKKSTEGMFRVRLSNTVNMATDIETRDKVLELDKGFCRFYGCRNPATEVHDIIPRSQGGLYIIENLVSLCSIHHRLFTDNKINEADFLLFLKEGRDFRWQRALEWHTDREELRHLKNKWRTNNA